MNVHVVVVLLVDQSSLHQVGHRVPLALELQLPLQLPQLLLRLILPLRYLLTPVVPAVLAQHEVPGQTGCPEPALLLLHFLALLLEFLLKLLEFLLNEGVLDDAPDPLGELVFGPEGRGQGFGLGSDFEFGQNDVFFLLEEVAFFDDGVLDFVDVLHFFFPLPQVQFLAGLLL